MKPLPTVLTALLAASLLLAFGIFAYPPPYTDSINYLPTAINFHAGKGLLNEVYPMARTLDPLGQGRFLHHMPLFPMLLGALMWQTSAQNIFIIIDTN